MSNTLQTPILTVFLWLFTPNTTDYRQNTYTIGYRPDLVLKLLLSSYCIHRWWMKLLLWQRCWQQQIMNVCQNSSSILQLPGNLLEENKPFFQTASHHLVFWWWFYKCSLTLQCVCVCVDLLIVRAAICASCILRMVDFHLGIDHLLQDCNPRTKVTTQKNFVLIWSDARKLKGFNLYSFFFK